MILSTYDYFFLWLLFAGQTIVLGLMFYLWQRQQRLREVLPQSTKRDYIVLSVVAGENLDLKEIEKALYSTNIKYNLLNYDVVNQDSILREIEKGVTIFELSSHGLNGKFRLGNQTLPISWLSEVIHNAKTVECILLLYCNSYSDLTAFDNLCSIGLVGDVSDKTCILFTRNFYYYLNKSYPFKEAFEAARLHLPVEDFSKFIYHA